MGIGDVIVNFEQMFDDSYERSISEKVGNLDFFEAFYARFLDKSDEIANRFVSTDMERQRNMLKKSFYSLLTFYASNNADHYLQQIAIKHSHSELDIRPEFYDLWMDALIETVREFDREYEPRIELAWRLVMAPGIVYMKFHYGNTS